jgi:phosphatidylglycerophosphate synthase
MLDAPLRRLVDPLLVPLARQAACRGVHADLVTFLGFALGLLAIAAIMAERYGLGLGLLLLNRIADGLDGAVARQTRLTDRGGFLDIVLDFIIYSGLVFAFAVADPARNALMAAFLIFAFMGTGASFLAFAVMAAKRGLAAEPSPRRSLHYLGGLTEGSETIAFLVLACLLPRQFPLLAAIFGSLCWLTTLGRIVVGYRLLREAGE